MAAASPGHEQVRDKEDTLLQCFKGSLVFSDYEPAALNFYEPIRSTGWVHALKASHLVKMPVRLRHTK